MNWLDLVVLLAVVLPVFMGVRNGIVGTVFTIAGLIVGIFVARMFNNEIAGVLGNFIQNETVQNVGAFVLVIVVALVVAAVAARLVKTMLKFLFLGWIDNVAGGALGFVMGASLAVGVIQIVGLTSPETVQASMTAPLLRDVWGPVVGVFLGNVQAWVLG